MTSFILEGGRALTAAGVIEPVDVFVSQGVFVDRAPADAERIDCRDRLVLPGMIDVHGDAFEREIRPRPEADFPIPIAMTSVDRQLLCCGITTAYHGLTLSWEPGARSLAAGRAFMAALAPLHPSLIADHRVQLRWETFALEAEADVMDWMAGDRAPALAFNDHTTSTVEKIRAGKHGKLDQWATRAGLSREQYLELVDTAWSRRADVPAAIERLAARARELAIPLLAHDEKTVAARNAARALGATISEFPLTREAAADARAHGEHTVLGAPNVVRGGSHTGALDAASAIRDGLCSVLASDYYYPSMLAAIAKLVTSDGMALPDAWALVSSNAADALGLDDRGQLAPGQRADVVVVAWPDGAAPRIVATLAAGRIGYRAA